MRYIIHDKRYQFKSAFDTKTGAYVRTGVLDADGKDTGVDPFMASYPHLIDVGIMGHCIHGKTGLCAKAGIGCYQSGMLVEQPNMSVEDFRWIAEQSKGRCNQFALGGRGDPDQHGGTGTDADRKALAGGKGSQSHRIQAQGGHQNAKPRNR